MVSKMKKQYIQPTVRVIVFTEPICQIIAGSGPTPTEASSKRHDWDDDDDYDF